MLLQPCVGFRLAEIVFNVVEIDRKAGVMLAVPRRLNGDPRVFIRVFIGHAVCHAALHGAIQHAFLLLHAAIARGNPQIDLVVIRCIDKRRELRVHFGVDGDGIEQRRGHLEIVRQRHFAVHKHKPPIAELLKGRFGSRGRFRKHTCFV